MTRKKIVSLFPAATDIICALGLKEDLAGRSSACDFPGVSAIPVCSSIESGFRSAAANIQDVTFSKEPRSNFALDVPLIQRLNPEIILIHEEDYQVCAESLNAAIASRNSDFNGAPQIISLAPKSLADVLSDIKHLADTLGAQNRGEALLEELQERLDLIYHKLKFVEVRPTVMCISSMDPLASASDWTTELIQIAGGMPVQAASDESQLDFSEILEANPDVLIVAPNGFSLDQTLQNLEILLQFPGWPELSAVKNNNVFIADGNQYFHRSSQKVMDTLELLAELIHPKQFVFGYKGTGWLPFNF